MPAKPSYAKKAHSNVDSLVDWAQDELTRLKSEVAAEILELAKSDDPNRGENIKAKMAAFKDQIAILKNVIAWCEADPLAESE